MYVVSFSSLSLILSDINGSSWTVSSWEGSGVTVSGPGRHTLPGIVSGPGRHTLPGIVSGPGKVTCWW